MTLVDVAARLDISYTTLLRYERGQMDPSPDKIRQLAEVYGCSAAELEFPPEERSKGRRIHQAMQILAEMDPELAEHWIKIGLTLKKAKPDKGPA